MINEILKDKLSIISNDDLLIKAIRAVFEEQVNKEMLFIQPGDNNSLIGEKYRACKKAEQIIANAFKDIESYKMGGRAEKPFRKEL